MTVETIRNILKSILALAIVGTMLYACAKTDNGPMNLEDSPGYRGHIDSGDVIGAQPGTN